MRKIEKIKVISNILIYIIVCVNSSYEFVHNKNFVKIKIKILFVVI